MDNNLLPTKAVYAYYFPEVRDIISRLANPYPHKVYLESIEPGLDDFHFKAIDAYLEASSSFLPGLSDFPFRYTSAGASESIFHVLAYLKTHTPETPVYVFDGEYEGYSGYAENIEQTVTSVSFHAKLSDLTPGIFFVSNPSARNGQVIDREFITSIGASGHRIIIDSSYVGLTQNDFEYVVNDPAVDIVLVSLSKPFGLYYYRIGFCFSKIEIKTLYVNKWFKNIFSHIIAETLLTELHLGELAKKYAKFQIRACAELSALFDVSITPSDVILLGYIHEKDVPNSKKEALSMYKRGEFYRFGLTPYFLKYEQEQ